MKRQRLEIGHPLAIGVHWYDYVCTEMQLEDREGEVVGWRDSQVIVRVKGYGVLRFWKHSGLEVGNGDHARRGFRVDLKELEQSLQPAPGVEVTLDAVGEVQEVQSP
jgi:hypothetical protein